MNQKLNWIKLKSSLVQKVHKKTLNQAINIAFASNLCLTSPSTRINQPYLIKQLSYSFTMPLSRTPVTTNSNCAKCMAADNDEMVECDVCDQWYHYSCANVGPEVEGSRVGFVCQDYRRRQSHLRIDDSHQINTQRW